MRLKIKKVSTYLDKNLKITTKVVIFVLNNLVMDNVDVQIYLSQIKTFFEQNPDELINLLGNAKPEDFFDGVARLAAKNLDNGEDVQLTNKQMIDLIVYLNGVQTRTIKKEVLVPYVEYKFGKIYLN
jgi:hypothetical protein